MDFENQSLVISIIDSITLLNEQYQQKKNLMVGCCVLTGLKCTIIVIPPPSNRFLKKNQIKIIIQNAIS